MGAYSVAATAASTPEMAKVSMDTRLASMPTMDAPSRFCAMAMMVAPVMVRVRNRDRKSTRLNSSHLVISYAVFCLKKKNWLQEYRHRRQLSSLPPTKRGVRPGYYRL